MSIIHDFLFSDIPSGISILHSNLDVSNPPCTIDPPYTIDPPSSTPYSTISKHANVPSLCRSSLLSTILLPDNHWHVIEHGDAVHLCEIRKTSNGTSTVTSSVIDNVWKVFIHDKKVPAKCPLLATFPDNILLSQVSTLVDTVHSAARCPGNPEENMWIFVRRGVGK